MPDYKKFPLPEINDNTRPFWEATSKGELRMQKCTDCGYIRYPINPVCTKCLSSNTEWVKLSGKGSVWSALVYHHVFNPAFADDVPYNVSMIQLDEGPRMFSNVVGCAPDAVKVGDAVEVTFDKVSDEITIPRFKPAK